MLSFHQKCFVRLNASNPFSAGAPHRTTLGSSQRSSRPTSRLGRELTLSIPHPIWRNACGVSFLPFLPFWKNFCGRPCTSHPDLSRLPPWAKTLEKKPWYVRAPARSQKVCNTTYTAVIKYIKRRRRRPSPVVLVVYFIAHMRAPLAGMVG